MRYFKLDSKHEANTAINTKSPEELNREYKDLVPSYYEWKFPGKQVQNADRSGKITDYHNAKK